MRLLFFRAYRYLQSNIVFVREGKPLPYKRYIERKFVGCDVLGAP